MTDWTNQGTMNNTNGFRPNNLSQHRSLKKKGKTAKYGAAGHDEHCSELIRTDGGHRVG